MYYSYEQNKYSFIRKVEKYRLSKILVTSVFLILLGFSLFVLRMDLLIFNSFLVILISFIFLGKSYFKQFWQIIIQFKFFLLISFFLSYSYEYNLSASFSVVLKFLNLFLYSYLINLSLDYFELLNLSRKLKKRPKLKYLYKCFFVLTLSLKVLPDLYKKGMLLKNQLVMRSDRDVNKFLKIKTYSVLFNSMFIHSILEAKQLEKTDRIYDFEEDLVLSKDRISYLSNFFLLILTVFYLIIILEVL